MGWYPASVYGVADVSITSQDSGFGRKLRMDGGGGKSASRLGLQITRDLGNDLRAIGVAEGGVHFNTGSTGGAAPATAINVTTPSDRGG